MKEQTIQKRKKKKPHHINWVGPIRLYKRKSPALFSILNKTQCAAFVLGPYFYLTKNVPFS